MSSWSYLATSPATGDGMVSVADAWLAIEKLVLRDQLAAALAVIAEMVPDDSGDGDNEWRRELVARYGTVRGFIRLLWRSSTSARPGPGQAWSTPCGKRGSVAPRAAALADLGRGQSVFCRASAQYVIRRQLRK